MGNRDDHQDDAQPEPVARSTRRCDDDERDAKHASVPLRRVRAGEARCEKFLYDFKAGLRAAACGGRPRPPPPRHNGTGLSGHPGRGVS